MNTSRNSNKWNLQPVVNNLCQEQGIFAGSLPVFILQFRALFFNEQIYPRDKSDDCLGHRMLNQ